MSELEKIISLWHEHKVSHIDYEFSCGGDSMNETTLNIIGIDENSVECKEIEDYFDNKVYDEVEFYVNSDGHYMGESGNVIIELVTEDTDEQGNKISVEPYFEYSKSSSEEWCEREQFDEMIELSDEEIEYISLYVNNINTSWGGDVNFNYGSDFIKTDRHEELEVTIAEKLEKFYNEYEPEVEGELSENDMSFNTNEDENVIKIEGNKIQLTLYFESYVYKEGE